MATGLVVAWWLAVPVAGAALLVVVSYRGGYDDEAGSRAGAEPVLAGVFVALPWVAVLCALVIAGLVIANLSATRHRVGVLAAATVLTLAVALGNAALVHPYGTPLAWVWPVTLLSPWVAQALATRRPGRSLDLNRG